MNAAAKKIINKANVAEHLLDEKHSYSHRCVYGFILMIIGVSMAKGMPHDIFILSFIGDQVGYFFHGAGCIPFIDWAHNKIKKMNS